jgi:hypothetical protein
MLHPHPAGFIRQAAGPGKDVAMGDVVIVAYRPKPGRADALMRLVHDHVKQLQEWGLATSRPPLILHAADGILVEIFEWHEGALARAHEDPRVHGMWAAFGAACDYVKLRDLAEAGEMFATFAPVGVPAA